jgi:hypothetical protein
MWQSGKRTFFSEQLTASFVVTALNEFANRGKLVGKLANSFPPGGQANNAFSRTICQHGRLAILVLPNA